jgi:hypothetical protein
MLDEPKYWLSLITGIVITALGGIPLLYNWGWIGFDLPFPLESSILLWAVAVGGLFLIISSFLSEEDNVMWVSILVAFVLMVIAIIHILNTFEVIGFGVPFLTLTVLRIMFVVEGLGLIVAGIFGDK